MTKDRTYNAEKQVSVSGIWPTAQQENNHENKVVKSTTHPTGIKFHKGSNGHFSVLKSLLSSYLPFDFHIIDDLGGRRGEGGGGGGGGGGVCTMRHHIITTQVPEVVTGWLVMKEDFVLQPAYLPPPQATFALIFNRLDCSGFWIFIF